jgi:hypothetical protein
VERQAERIEACAARKARRRARRGIRRRAGFGGAGEALAAAGDHRLACHLADFALEAAPSDPQVQANVAAIYDKRAAAEQSLMAINIFNSAAAYARAGRPFA